MVVFSGVVDQQIFPGRWLVGVCWLRMLILLLQLLHLLMLLLRRLHLLMLLRRLLMLISLLLTAAAAAILTFLQHPNVSMTHRLLLLLLHLLLLLRLLRLL